MGVCVYVYVCVCHVCMFVTLVMCRLEYCSQKVLREARPSSMLCRALVCQPAARPYARTRPACLRHNPPFGCAGWLCGSGLVACCALCAPLAKKPARPLHMLSRDRPMMRETTGDLGTVVVQLGLAGCALCAPPASLSRGEKGDPSPASVFQGRCWGGACRNRDL